MKRDIDARAPGLPTKDQMRLMVQSLLADDAVRRLIPRDRHFWKPCASNWG